MIGLLDRLEDANDREALADIASRLEAGEEASEIASEPGRDPFVIVVAIALSGMIIEGPPLVRDSPRRPKLKPWASEPALARLFPRSSRPSRLALSAGLLQVLDFWDESHEAAQEAGDLGERLHSPYWHAIAHRREPDPENAKYWSRRAGRHPVFDQLARTAKKAWLDDHDDRSLLGRLVPGGAWDPIAFVDFCRPGSSFQQLAMQIQAAEIMLLLDASAEALGQS